MCMFKHRAQIFYFNLVQDGASFRVPDMVSHSNNMAASRGLRMPYVIKISISRYIP